MSNIEKAKKILESGYTCVLVGDNIKYCFNDSGISPLLNVVHDELNVEGFALADKIVGKAVAMLATKLKISEVFADVISESAISFLEENKIPYSYKTRTPYIVNRKGDGECPMEETVKNIDDLDLAVIKLTEKLQSLKKALS